MNALNVIQSTEQLGFVLIAEGDDIRVKKGKRLPDSLRANIIDYKPQILATLRRDKKAKQTGLVICIPGELYAVSINKNSSIYIDHMENRWEAWRETHYLKQNAPSNKTIATGCAFEDVLPKVKQYLEYISRGRLRNSSGNESVRFD
ncbi:hypothetical protein [Halalkalibacter flavus]|uniref:hypothetical protein n=1 Tax=Halalkalibacter flavus TaxID=3090668 RepID=UPI002FCB51BC